MYYHINTNLNTSNSSIELLSSKRAVKAIPKVDQYLQVGMLLKK